VGPATPQFVGAPERGDWFRNNDAVLRSSPLYVGATAVALLVLNRALSGEALAVDASTAQSRAEVLVLALSTSLVLTGLNWVALTPRAPLRVQLQGEPVLFAHPQLAPGAQAELLWLWRTLQGATACGSLAVFYRGRRALQAGLAPPGCGAAAAPALGPLCEQAVSSGTANYFANLALYPGRLEFLPYLPANAQAVVVQPLGSEGVLVAASDTQRGFTQADQRWLALVAQKLDSTLDASFKPID